MKFMICLILKYIYLVFEFQYFLEKNYFMGLSKKFQLAHPSYLVTCVFMQQRKGWKVAEFFYFFVFQANDPIL